MAARWVSVGRVRADRRDPKFVNRALFWRGPAAQLHLSLQLTCPQNQGVSLVFTGTGCNTLHNSFVHFCVGWSASPSNCFFRGVPQSDWNVCASSSPANQPHNPEAPCSRSLLGVRGMLVIKNRQQSHASFAAIARKPAAKTLFPICVTTESRSAPTTSKSAHHSANVRLPWVTRCSLTPAT